MNSLQHSPDQSHHHLMASRERQRPEKPATDVSSSSPIAPRADAGGAPLDRCDPKSEYSAASIAADDSVGARKRRPRKLDLEMKEQICRLVLGGHTLSAAAHMVGVSPRTVYREKDHDLLFKRRLNQGRQNVAQLCLHTMEAAAAEKWQAAERYYKLVYPDRYYYRPETISLKKHYRWTTEVVRFLQTVCTPEQMRELDRLLNPPPKLPHAPKTL